ncbi:MAG: TonB-dependent receptor [Woeseiaceae bacterium]|nr:TonB-dependent receptor [Woeseiaceae bacterium]
MQSNLYRKTPIAQAVAVAVGATALTPAAAQDTGSGGQEVYDEVVVTGIRGSLRQSMDLKRGADGVVDAISAEDIGDFPDTNLAESLQRITGVSIDRERGEGARVTVRGFGPDFNLVTLNGRQMPTAGGIDNVGTGRSFDFGNLASEGVSAVEVYKSGRADVPSGGIGSTINIRTTRPLENPGLAFTFAASGVIDESRTDLRDDDFTPEISGLYSDTFMNDTVGVAISAVRQERKSGGATASVGGWRTFTGETSCWGCGGAVENWGGIPTAADPNQVNRPDDSDIYSVPQVIGYELADYDRVRTNGQLTLQYRPIDTFTATLDYTYSELELDRVYNNYSSWFNFGAQETVWTDGPNASALEYTENLGGQDFAMGAGRDAIKNENGSIGLNLMWDVSDWLTLELDYHDSTAENSPNSPNGTASLLAISSFTRDRTSGYFNGAFPVLELGLSNPLDPNDMIVTGSVFTTRESKMDIEQLELSGNYGFDSGFIESVDFGLQLTTNDNRATVAVVQRDAWGGVTQPGAIADLMVPANASGAFDQIPGGTDPRRQMDFYTYDINALIDRTSALIASGDASLFIPGNGNLGACGDALCPSAPGVLDADRRTSEDTEAFYVQLNMATEFGRMPVDMRLGLRYEQTDVLSTALSPNYTTLRWSAPNELALVSDGNTFTSLGGDYDATLPNFDFAIDLTDSVIARFSWSKTLTRPTYDRIQGGITLDSPVRINGGTGRRGNPELLPFESTNIDLSVEWYYGDDNYAAIGYFDKDVKNFIGDGQVDEVPVSVPHPAFGPLGDQARATGLTDAGEIYNWILDNLPNEQGVDPVARTIEGIPGRDGDSPFVITIPVNIDKARVDGWELVVQHNFGDTGFGVIANATFVDADVGFDNLSLAEQFVIPGLSDSANLVGYYETDNFGIRLAWNWRDAFINGTGQTNVGSGPPTYVDEYEQWDLNANYWWNDNFQVFMDVLNITDEVTHVYGRTNLQTLFATQLGTRYNIGVRYKF